MRRSHRSQPEFTRSATATLVLDNVAMEYGGGRSGAAFRAIDNISFDIASQEFVALVGKSGCGKTTCLKIIAQMLEPSAGGVAWSDGPVRNDDIGFVFQDASLFPWRTVLQNAMFGLELTARRSTGRADDVESVRDILRLVGLAEFEDFYPHQLSGGMQQRVNLARALAVRPRLLLMDEPFGSLDAQTREELQDELQRVAVEARTTIVFVTHDIREAVYLADKVVVLSERPSRVKSIIEIETPRPRPSEFQISEEFAERTREVWQMVHSSPPAREPGAGSNGHATSHPVVPISKGKS